MSKIKRIGKDMPIIMYGNQMLGEGAYSRVYKGILEDTKQEVAIKVMDKKTIQKDQYSKKAFKTQITIMKKLKSPNIINLISVKQTSNNTYLVLQIAEGTLRQIIRKKGPLTQEMSISCLIQILNGYGQLMKNGVIHRDLKPENILVKDKTLKIADFGFAKHLENKNDLLKTVVGTAAYMAPQILNRERYTYKCDIWSIGIIAYQLIVGRVPWQNGYDFQSQLFRQEILTKKVVIPESIKVSEGMKNFIYGCLCIDENKRFDQQKLFKHPIFGEIYYKNFSKSKEGSFKVKFIISDFRMNLHSKNVNLQKILTKLGNKLNKCDFQKLIRSIYQDISPQDLLLFYKYLQKNEQIDIQQLCKFLIKNDCNLKGINLSDNKMDVQQGQSQQNLEYQLEYKLIDRIKNSISKNNISINKIFNNIKQNIINIQIFKDIITIIDPSLNQNQISVLFKQFDLRAKQQINKRDLFQNICKIAQQLPNQDVQ